MNKKNITPNPSQPVDRVPSGQLPSALAELSEEAIGGSVSASYVGGGGTAIFCSYSEEVSASYVGSNGTAIFCSYDGDNAE